MTKLKKGLGTKSDNHHYLRMVCVIKGNRFVRGRESRTLTVICGPPAVEMSPLWILHPNNHSRNKHKGAGTFHSAGQSKEGNLVLALPSIRSYLIFVIFLHMQNFWRIKFTPKYTVNYCVLLCITVYYTVNTQ